MLTNDTKPHLLLTYARYVINKHICVASMITNNTNLKERY